MQKKETISNLLMVLSNIYNKLKKDYFEKVCNRASGNSD